MHFNRNNIFFLDALLFCSTCVFRFKSTIPFQATETVLALSNNCWFEDMSSIHNISTQYRLPLWYLQTQQNKWLGDWLKNQHQLFLSAIAFCLISHFRLSSRFYDLSIALEKAAQELWRRGKRATQNPFSGKMISNSSFSIDVMIKIEWSQMVKKNFDEIQIPDSQLLEIW